METGGGFFHDLVFNLSNACNDCCTQSTCNVTCNCCNTAAKADLRTKDEYYVDATGTLRQHHWYNLKSTVMTRRAQNVANTVDHLQRKYGDFSKPDGASDFARYIGYLSGVNCLNICEEPWTGLHLRKIQVAVNALGKDLVYWKRIQKIYQVIHQAPGENLVEPLCTKDSKAALVSELMARQSDVRLDKEDLLYLRREGVTLGNLGDFDRGRDVARRIYYLARTLEDLKIPESSFDELVESCLPE